MEGVCMACLATNRRLFPVEHVSKLTVFKLLTQETIRNPTPTSYNLCWECTAQLHSVYKFQIKARKSLQTLESYFNRSLMIPTVKVYPCLSRLQSTKAFNVDWVPEPNVKSEIEVAQYFRYSHIEHDAGLPDVDSIKMDDECEQKHITADDTAGVTGDSSETLLPTTSHEPHTRSRDRCTRSEKQRRMTTLHSGEGRRIEKTHKPKKNIRSRTEDQSCKMEDRKSRNITKMLTFENATEKRKRVKKQSIVGETSDRSDPAPPDVTPRDECFDSDSTVTADEDCVMSESDLPTSNIKKKGPFIEIEVGPKSDTFDIEPLYPIVTRRDSMEDEITWKEIPISEQQRVDLATTAMNELEYVTAPFKCDGCILGFWTEGPFATHNNKYHRGELGPYVCDICKCRFEDKTSMKEHCRRHRVLFDCMKCAFNARRYEDILRHHTNHHTTILHDCRDCDMKFPTLSKLYRHRMCHKPEHKCGRCGKIFSQYALMAKHYRDTHKPKPTKQHQCPICKKLCKTNLKLHIKLVHGEQEEVYCGPCKRFYKVNYYEMHLKTKQIHMKPEGFKYTCEKCGKKFTRNIDLVRHDKGIHLKDKPYSCDMCPKRYVHIDTLKRHKEVAHTEGYKQTRNYICEACGKAFYTRSILLEHKVTHTGERPHKCGLCPATFGFKAALYTHNKLVHEKVKRVWPKKKKKSDRSNVKLTDNIE